MHKGSVYWLKHVEAIAREGVSTNAYAKAHGLEVKRLYYWQRKALGVSVSRAKKDAGTFVALRVKASDDASASKCTLILPSGLRLEMAMLPAPTWLARLGRACQGAY